MKLTALLKKYKGKFGFTLVLILLEAGLTLLSPLFIGFAIDDAINGKHQGAVELGLLGLSVLVVGAGRRVFDSRFYARFYQFIGSSAVSKMEDQGHSKRSARLAMIRELVEFLENSLPELISNMIGLIGVIAIIATLSLHVFYGSLMITLIIFSIYWLTSSKTIRLNKQSNDEFEKQVGIIAKNDPQDLRLHLKRMMQWNIKLSDLEALNFSVSWMVLIGFLISSILIVTGDGIVKYGAIFSLIMYVFQYMESVVNLPLFYQNWLRLKEIIRRLERI